MKRIRLSAHAASYMAERGFDAAEVEQAIRGATWEPAFGGRLQARKNFPFQSIWNRKRYETKQVRPIFVDDEDEIVVVTVYTYYF
jgi:hypothetical protein